MIKKLALSLIAAAAVCLPSCNSLNDGNNGSDGDAAIKRFVTLASKSDDGCTFTYYDANDNMYTLTSTYKINATTVNPGHRLILAYNCNWGTADKSGAVDVLGAYNVINGTLQVGSSVQLSTPQYQVYPTQTGPYLNIEARVPVVDAPKTYKVIMDESTIDSEYPTVNLVFESDKEPEGTYKDIYASFDMSSIWNNTQYKGYRLNAVVTAYTGSSSTWLISKPNKQTITPAN